MASSINATLSNINRRFEKIKSSVPHKYLTLKQILPQLEVFEGSFDDEFKWQEEGLTALEAYRNVNTLEEVEGELQRYKVGR